MKLWILCEPDENDETIKCYSCGMYICETDNYFMQFELISGLMPNPTELHHEPTGKFLCLSCGKEQLV